MRSRRLGHACLLTLACALALPVSPQPALAEGDGVDYEELPLSEVPEPSGIVFHPQRGTVFVVGDEGHVAELELDGSVKRVRQIGGDLEGVACDPGSGALWVADEREDALIELRLSDLAIARRVPVDRAFGGDAEFLRPAGDGIEGITFVPQAGNAAAVLFAVNQFDPPVLLELSGASSADGRVRIREAWPLGSPPLSDVTWDPPSGGFLVVSALWRKASVVSRGGEVLRTVALPGIMQEGLARLPDGSFLITQDTGGLIRWRPPSDPFVASSDGEDDAAKRAARSQDP